MDYTPANNQVVVTGGYTVTPGPTVGGNDPVQQNKGGDNLPGTGPYLPFGWLDPGGPKLGTTASGDTAKKNTWIWLLVIAGVLYLVFWFGRKKGWFKKIR